MSGMDIHTCIYRVSKLNWREYKKPIMCASHSRSSKMTASCIPQTCPLLDQHPGVSVKDCKINMQQYNNMEQSLSMYRRVMLYLSSRHSPPEVPRGGLKPEWSPFSDCAQMLPLCRCLQHLTHEMDQSLHTSSSRYDLDSTLSTSPQ